MKKEILTAVLCIIGLFSVRAGDTVLVGNNTIKVPALGQFKQYYAFNEGDVVLFSMEEKNGKEVSELEILEYPSSSISMEYKTKKVENKQLLINHKAIYIFLFKNTAISPRIINFTIKRIPINEEFKQFNSTVYFKTIYDTTYQDIEEEYLFKTDTIVSERLSTNTQISSKNALNGNANYVKTSFQLPPNTIAWSYYISTSKEAQKTFEKDREAFTNQTKTALSGMIGMDPMGALALGGISYFTKLQGEDNVAYQFTRRATQTTPALTFKTGDTKFETNHQLSPLQGTIDVLLTNDNIAEPISVTFKVSAVSINKIYNKRIVKKMNIATSSIPYTR